MLKSFCQSFLLYSLFHSFTYAFPSDPRPRITSRDDEIGNRPIDQAISNMIPSRSSRALLPRTLTQPLDPISSQFQDYLMRLSSTPLQYENPRLINKALSVIPLSKLDSEAKEECQRLRTQAGDANGKPVWGYPDCLLRAMLRYAHQSASGSP